MYSVFLESVRMPVTPSALELQINNKNETSDLINGGEINRIKVPGLTDINFELELPNVQYPYAVYPSGFRNASYYLEHIESLKTSSKPFRFIMTRLKANGEVLFDTNLLVSLEDYTISEDAENGSDVTVSINLKQYRPYSTKTLNITKTATNTNQVSVSKARDTSTKVTPKSHKVVSGDTLWLIAKKYLGNGSLYPQLAKKNNIPNPDLIYPGQVIRLD